MVRKCCKLGPRFLALFWRSLKCEWITSLHRGLLAVDLALVWTLWPGYRSGWGVRLRPKAAWRLVWPGFLSSVAVAYVVLVATFPDERMFLATDWLHGSTYLDPSIV